MTAFLSPNDAPADVLELELELASRQNVWMGKDRN